jgi:hypothetical protein
MKVKPSLPLLAVPLIMAMLVLVSQFPTKTNATSLRRGSQGIVTPSSPVVLPQQVQAVPMQRQRTVQDELAQVFAAAPSVSSSSKGRKGTGDACIGPLCGLGLFFGAIALTFAACFVVLYVAEKRFDRVQGGRRRREYYYENSLKRRSSKGHLDFRRNCTGTALRSPSAMRQRAAQ